MADRSALEAAARVLRSASSVLIGAHVDPDGDAIGSTLGLMHILDSAGIASTPVLPGSGRLPATYRFLPGADRYVHAADAPTADVFVSLDSPDTRRLGDAEALAKAAPTLVMVDHHPDAVAGESVAVLDSTAAATGCIVWSLADALGVFPGTAAATCLYTALLTDTGRFSYGNTSASTLRLAADMVDAGAHAHDIYSAVYENRTAGAQALLGRALSRVALVNGARVAYSWVNDADFAETGALPSEAENLIDFVRALGGVDAVLLVKSNAENSRVSLRAKSDIDVGAIARAHGGGGHRAAAGVTIEGTREDALAALLPELPGGRG